MFCDGAQTAGTSLLGTDLWTGALTFCVLRRRRIRGFFFIVFVVGIVVFFVVVVVALE